MPKLIALKPFTYLRRTVATGQVFEASNRDARIFIALRRATLAPVVKPAPPQAPEPVQTSRRRTRKPEPVMEDVFQEEPVLGLHYSTRHLTAESEPE